MSGLFEKTIESIHSLLSASHVSLSPKYMYEKCFGARTKREEEIVFCDCLKTIKEHLSEPGVRSSTVKKCLAFVAFAEMMGYKAEFAYIHAVKLAQQGSISEKKLGYMVCIQLLRDSHDLSPLLVNTVLRDLASRNVIIIAMALAASCYLIPPDQAGSVLSMVVDKLNNCNEIIEFENFEAAKSGNTEEDTENSIINLYCCCMIYAYDSQEYIRGKAVIVMHHFLKTSPDQAMPYIHSVRTLLGDRDPGVVSHVLSYLLHVAQEYPEYAPDLASSVMSVQDQIITGKLPKDYLHHGMSAPWAQVTIMRLLRKLRPAFGEVQTLLDNTLRILGDLSTPMAAAIAVECLITMLELSGTPNEQLVTSTISIVGQLLSNKNSNLRYEGLTLMMALSSHHQLKLRPKEESVVESFLSHPDESLRLQTLNLMCSVADKTSAEGICNQILDFIKLEQPPLQFRLVAQAASLADRFPGSNYWHLALLLRLLPLAEPSEVANLQAKIMMALRDDRDQSVATARKKVLGYLRKHSESKSAPTNVLELYVWGLSHFHSVADLPSSDSPSNIAAMRAIASLGHKILQNATQPNQGAPCAAVSTPIKKLLLQIVRAEARLIKSSSSVEVADNVVQLIEDLISASKSHVCADVVLRCLCEELQKLMLGHPGRVLENPVAPDWTLSFLDETICAHLESDGKPLSPLRVGLSPHAALHEMLEAERLKAGLAASAPVQETVSLGSSEVSLAGTEAEEGPWPHGSSSASSSRSGCWVYAGPQVETSVWTKDGRVKMETPDSAKVNSPLSTETPKPETLSPQVLAADPLDELEKTFSETVS